MENSPWFENDGSQYSLKENKNKDGIGLLFYIDTKEIIHAILWWGGKQYVEINRYLLACSPLCDLNKLMCSNLWAFL